jgi:hypothetical protein
MLHKKTAVAPIVEAILAKQPSKSAIAPKAEIGESAIALRLKLPILNL